MMSYFKLPSLWTLIAVLGVCLMFHNHASAQLFSDSLTGILDDPLDPAVWIDVADSYRYGGSHTDSRFSNNPNTEIDNLT